MPLTVSMDYIPFVPVIDGFMLHHDPERVREYANNIEVLMGWTSRETLNYILSEAASKRLSHISEDHQKYYR